MPLRALFLDIDGVLNSRQWYDRRPDEPVMGRVDELASKIDPMAVARLNLVVMETGCVVVLSSTWRCTDPISNIGRALRQRGFASYLFGATPPLGNPRGKEIAAWLRLATVDSFAILDDDNDMGELLGRLVQTDVETGLQDRHHGPLVRLLGGKD